MLFIASLISTFLLQLPTTTAEAQVCLTGAGNVVTVNTQWITAPAALSKDYINAAKELQALSSTVAQLKDDSLLTATLTSQDSFENRLAKAQADFATARKHVVDAATSIDASHRLASTKLIEGYFKIGYTLLSLDLLTHPVGPTIESVRNTYGLTLTQKQLEEIYPQNLGMSDGTEARMLKVQNSNQATYQLVWSNENIYRLLVRAAALSKTMRDSKQAYLSTVRCELGRLMLGKLIANESILGEEGMPLPVSAEQKLCLNSTVSELNEIALNDSQFNKEQILRKSLSKHWPKLIDDKDIIVFFLMFGSKIGKLDLLLNPDDANNTASEILAKSGNPSKVNFDAKALSQNFYQYVLNQYLAVPELNPLKSLWGDSQLTKLLLGTFNDCQFAIQDTTFGTPIDEKTLVEMLNKSDSLTFIFSLLSGINTSRAQMMTMNEAQLKLFLRDFIKIQRRDATLQTILYFYVTYQHPKTYDISDLMAAVRKAALPLIDQRIEQIWKSAALDKYIDTLAADILANRNSAQIMQSALKEYSTGLVAAAKSVETILDPKITAAENLPYDDAALKRALSPKVATLSANTRALVNVMSAEKSFDKRKQIWTELKALLQKRADKADVSCRPINLVDRLHEGDERQAVQRECAVVSFFAGALGLDEKTAPTQFLNSYYYMKQQLSSTDLEAVIGLYRAELVAPILNEYRPLMYHVDATKADSETLSHYFAHRQAPEKGELPKLREAIDRSIQISRHILAKIVNAKKESDLDWLITKTNVINDVLGQGQLADYLSNLNGFSQNPNDPTGGQQFAVENARNIAERSLNEREGFVFPNLIAYHKHLQDTSVQNDFLEQDIRDEFMMAHGTLGTYVMGGLLFKWAYGFAPRWMFRGAVTSSLEGLFGLTNNAMGAWGDYVTLLILDHAYGTYQAKQNFQVELEHVSDLLHADALKVGATDNPLPLVDWDTYSRVHNLYDSKDKAATSAIWQDAFWGLFPFSYSTVGRLIGKAASNSHAKSNAKIENMSTAQRMAFEETLRRRATRQLAKLQFNLSALRNPHSLDLSELYMSLQTIRNKPLSKTKTGQAIEIQRAEDAYKKIINELGGQIQIFKDHPNLMESYAKSLFGEGGTAHQLDEIYAEWVRIVVNGEAP